MRALPLALLVALAGCNAVWGIESGTPLADAGGADTSTDPCSAAAGVARICVTLTTQKHPAYDVSTGATTLKIDGKGVYHLFIYDQDPNDPSVNYTGYFRYPAEGSEAAVDDHPSFVLTLSPGQHWFMARFEDNKNVTRTNEDYLVAGDAITVPSRTSTGKWVYASASAADNEAKKLDIPLLPMRRVDLDVVADASMRTAYKDYAVNGDGPLAIAIYDGDFDTSVYLDFLSTRCYAAAPMSVAPTLIQTHFATVVTGMHKLAVALEDYDSTTRFPTRGSLLCPVDTSAPTVNISDSNWTSTASAKFTQIVNPFKAGEGTDANRCP